MLVFFARSGARHPVLPVALGLVLGGSIANLLDRVRLGHVTDFLDFRPGPRSTSPTSFIVVGVAILFGALVRRRPTARSAARARLGDSPFLALTLRPARASTARSRRAARSVTRSLAERLIADGAVRVDGERRSQEPPARGRGGRRVELPAAAPRLAPRR